MKDRNTCPVCGKPGIPDYFSDDVVCPQCGSNLSVYKMLNECCTQKAGHKWLWIALIIVLSITLLILGTFSYKQCNDLSTSRQKYGEIEQQLAIANDSIKSLKAQLNTYAASTPNCEQNKELYIVRYGDSFWKISQRFFRRGAMASIIARDNNKKISDILIVGDTLIINR